MTSIFYSAFASLSPGAIAGIVGAVTLIVGVLAGLFGYRLYSQNKVGLAKREAERIVEEAKLEAKDIRKDGLIEAKEQLQKMRSEFDKETHDRRAELQRSENRIVQKEAALDKKEETLDRKQAELEQANKQVEATKAKLKEIEDELSLSQEKMERELERVSQLTKEEAAAQLKAGLLESVKRDSALEAKEIEAQAKEQAEKKAKNIISLAIQRCAADHAADSTVSVVALPSDEMKGRIIGRVGRNIRALESATGVDVIIDDTPDVVTLSSFDPVRREIARITLEKLVADGRIHPARIEEMVDKVKKEVDQSIKEAGEEAVFDAGVHGLHPELVRLLGRLRYRTSYGQNVLKHSLEVAFLAAIMASELGVDAKLAKRAGLLHDIGKAIDHETEGTHIQIGVDIAKKYKESPAVINAIAAHHGDCEPQTVEAVLIQAADAISGARPGARRESLENYVKRIEKLETLANSFDGVEQSYAIQAGREIRVIVKPEKVNDAGTVFLAKEIANKYESELEYPGQIKVSVIANKYESELEYPGQIKVSVIREVRSVDYAK